MKLNKVLTGCGAAALLLAASAATATPEISGGTKADRDALLAIAEAWVEAYTDGDIDMMMSLMHEDAMVMAENQATVHGLEAVRAYFEPKLGAPGVSFTDQLEEIRINGNWAYVRGSFLLEVAPRGEDGEPYRRKGRYFVLYEKNETGEWKMLRDIDNAAPPGGK